LKRLVRAEALEDFSSSELLDQLLVVIGSKSWILLGILVAVITVATIWGVIGEVPIMINGEGIIVEKNAPLVVENPTASGAVLETPVKPGDVVAAGGLLLIIGNPDLETKLSTAKRDLKLLRKNNASAIEREDETRKKEQAAANLQFESILATLDRTRKLITMYEQQVKDQTDLAEKKLIPASELVSTQAVLFQAEETEKAQFASLAQIESQTAAQDQSITLARQVRAEAIEEAVIEVERFKTQLASAQHVYAPMRCRIVEINVSRGSFVAPGDPVATVLPVTDETVSSTDSAPIVVVGFVSYGKGKELEPGMPVRIGVPYAPTTEYGFIKGTVRSIASFASDEESVSRQLGSDTLAKRILTETPVPLEVKVDLETDGDTKSGLAWTSSKGFPGQIPSLSECTFQITMRIERPIALVIPWLKERLGVDVGSEQQAAFGSNR